MTDEALSLIEARAVFPAELLTLEVNIRGMWAAY
jgi:hypothetical protein